MPGIREMPHVRSFGTFAHAFHKILHRRTFDAFKCTARVLHRLRVVFIGSVVTADP